MIARHAKRTTLDALGFQATVAIIGPRQVGKTTLACEIADEAKAVYLDLEDRTDRQKLEEPRLFLERLEHRLVIMDEIHRVPGLFGDLRGIIDRGRRKGIRAGRFLVLGPASVDLLRQSGETLAGRTAYVEMGPAGHTGSRSRNRCAGSPLGPRLVSRQLPSSQRRHQSQAQQHFIRTYLERDVAAFGPRLPPASLDRLWTMLAHSQGAVLNASPARARSEQVPRP